ncbi:uncharacterized protein [Dysidea avara]|uniref:uncharacterized protein n=1 Tax=Dysidea avara TaxID=196820 RepID=UPI00331D5D96
MAKKDPALYHILATIPGSDSKLHLTSVDPISRLFCVDSYNCAQNEKFYLLLTNDCSSNYICNKEFETGVLTVIPNDHPDQLSAPLTVRMEPKDASKCQTFLILSPSGSSQLSATTGDLVMIQSTDQRYTLVPGQDYVKAYHSDAVDNPYLFSMDQLNDNT